MTTNFAGAKSLAYLRGEIQIKSDRNRTRKLKYDTDDPLKGLKKCPSCTGWIFKDRKLCYGCAWVKAQKKERVLTYF